MQYIYNRERLSSKLGFQLNTHPPVLQHVVQAKLNLLFGQFLVDGWVLWLCWIYSRSLQLDPQLLRVTDQSQQSGFSWRALTSWRATSGAMSTGLSRSWQTEKLVSLRFQTRIGSYLLRIDFTAQTDEMKLIRFCITVQGFTATHNVLFTRNVMRTQN